MLFCMLFMYTERKRLYIVIMIGLIKNMISLLIKKSIEHEVLFFGDDIYFKIDIGWKL